MNARGTVRLAEVADCSSTARARRRTAPEPLVTREQAIANAGQVIAEDLLRQQTRPAREAAVASLGRDATPEQIDQWIKTYRPAASRTA